MKNQKVNLPTNGIGKFTNVVSDELCKKLRNYHTENIDQACDKKHDDIENTICKELYILEGPLHVEIQKCLIDLAQRYAKMYPYFRCFGDTGYQLRKLTGNTRRHVDGCPFIVGNELFFINVSVILGLNDDFGEGTFYLPTQDYKTTIKKGEAVCFPVGHAFEHYTDTPIGDRYSIQTWFHEGVFNYHPSVHPSGTIQPRLMDSVDPRWTHDS